MNNNLDLRNAARGIDLPPGDVDAVTARGATLARRRHRVLAGGLTVSLIAASAGIYARMNQPKPIPVAAGGASAKRGDVPIRWEKVESTSGLGFTTMMSEEALYAVSTGPGPARIDDPRRVVWRSDNGIDWAAVSELKGDLYIANLGDRGGRLYGVGTGAATAAVAGRKPVPDLVVGASDDGGHNWAKQTLPIDVRAISAKSQSVGVYAIDVATTKDAVVAVASLLAELDVPALLPQGQSAPKGWAYTDAGVDVLGDGPECPAGTTTSPAGQPDKRAMTPNQTGQTGPQRQFSRPCYGPDGTARDVTPQESRGVKASYTWAQLNVDGDLLRAVRSEPMVFRADAGSLKFERVDAPEVSRLDGPGLLDRDGDGLLMVGQRGLFPNGMKPVENSILRSADGRTWKSAPAPAGLSYALAVDQLDGRTAIVGETASGPTLWVSDGVDGWTPTSLASAVDPSARDKANVSLISAAVGKLGVVAVVSVNRDPIAEKGGVAITRDGYTLHIENDRWAGYVTDKSGKELARSDNVMDGRTEGALRGGTADGSVTLVDDAGKVLVRFTPNDLKNAYGTAREGTKPAFRILASRDGLTWSDQPVNDLAGQNIGSVLRVLMTGEKAIVAVSPATSGSQPSTKQIALVGTPR